MRQDYEAKLEISQRRLRASQAQIDALQAKAMGSGSGAKKKADWIPEFDRE